MSESDIRRLESDAKIYILLYVIVIQRLRAVPVCCAACALLSCVLYTQLIPHATTLLSYTTT